MHIVGILLAALGAIGIILWRLHMASEAARGLVDTANDVRGLLRRRRWQKKLDVDPLAQVEDPRMAATAMMVAIAQNDGALTEREQGIILGNLSARFDAKAPLNEEMFAHARWIVRGPRDIDTTLRKLMAVIQRQCGPTEVAETFDMLEDVANADCAPGSMEKLAIEKLRRSLRK